jgi:UDP-glucose 4-epimerase
VSDSLGFAQVLKEGWDAVFHFAAVVSVPQCEQEPNLSFKTNYQSLQTLLEVCKSLSKKPFVFFASSAAVYGDLCKRGDRLSENTPLPAPTSFYGLHKYSAEQSLRMYCERFGLHGMSFRFFNVYGPNQKVDSPYSGVISKFTRAFETRSEITLFNSGKNERDFIHVSDIVSACVSALALSPEQLNGEILNLCTGKSMTIHQVFTQMLEKYHLQESQVELKLAPPRIGDIEFSCGNPELAFRKLNWIPRQSGF